MNDIRVVVPKHRFLVVAHFCPLPKLSCLNLSEHRIPTTGAFGNGEQVPNTSDKTTN